MLSWKLNIQAFKNINRFGTKSCSFWMKICKMCEKLTKNCHRAVKLTPFKVLSWKIFASYQKILFSFSESWIIELEKILYNDRPIMSPSGSKLAKCKIFRKSKFAMKQNHYNELQNRFSQKRLVQKFQSLHFWKPLGVHFDLVESKPRGHFFFTSYTLQNLWQHVRWPIL